MYEIDVFRGKHLAEGKVAEFTVYVRKEGRITVPREVRAALAIKEGHLVKCKIERLGVK
jgi:bifunctional DNA-binding transcriptional regulator/antitoxin component of YhaV-PrlF toxin-antitoxin module